MRRRSYVGLGIAGLIVAVAIVYFAWVEFAGDQAITYRNDQYGFTFALPADWRGYTIVSGTWNGTLNGPNGPSSSTPETGPELSIRNPHWSAQSPRQDIPIMIFTPQQWQEVSQGNLITSAAPVPPGKLGSNANYVFALPARYNYAYPQGWQEVNAIILSNPLRGF